MRGLAKGGMTMICLSGKMGFARQVDDRVIVISDDKTGGQAPPDPVFDISQHERGNAFPGQILGL